MGDKYKEIFVFTDDVRVSKIFLRVNKAVEVIRSGKRLRTNVVFTLDDLKDIFNFYSEQARIPFIDSKVDLKLKNVDIIGLNSGDENSYLIICKKTAYSLLEKPFSKKKLIQRNKIGRLPQKRRDFGP